RGGRARRLRSGGAAVREAARDLLGVARSDAGHAAGQRYRHAVALSDLRRRGRGARGGRAERRELAEGTVGARLRKDHDGDLRSAAVLLRRGLSPAISREESRRILRSRRLRRALSRDGLTGGTRLVGRLAPRRNARRVYRPSLVRRLAHEAAALPAQHEAKTLGPLVRASREGPPLRVARLATLDDQPALVRERVRAERDRRAAEPLADDARELRMAFRGRIANQGRHVAVGRRGSAGATGARDPGRGDEPRHGTTTMRFSSHGDLGATPSLVATGAADFETPLTLPKGIGGHPSPAMCPRAAAKRASSGSPRGFEKSSAT